MKADVVCENPACQQYGKVINTIEFPIEEEDTLFEGYGHGAEDDADSCLGCGQLGVLKDPYLTKEELDVIRLTAKSMYESDEVEFDDDAEVSHGVGTQGVWIRARIWVDLSDGLPLACECDNTHKANDTVCRWCWVHGRRKWNDPEVKENGHG